MIDLDSRNFYYIFNNTQDLHIMTFGSQVSVMFCTDGVLSYLGQKLYSWEDAKTVIAYSLLAGKNCEYGVRTNYTYNAYYTVFSEFIKAINTHHGLNLE